MRTCLFKKNLLELQILLLFHLHKFSIKKYIPITSYLKIDENSKSSYYFVFTNLGFEESDEGFVSEVIFFQVIFWNENSLNGGEL